MRFFFSIPFITETTTLTVTNHYACEQRMVETKLLSLSLPKFEVDTENQVFYDHTIRLDIEGELEHIKNLV